MNTCYSNIPGRLSLFTRKWRHGNSQRWIIWQLVFRRRPPGPRWCDWRRDEIFKRIADGDNNNRKTNVSGDARFQRPGENRVPEMVWNDHENQEHLVIRLEFCCISSFVNWQMYARIWFYRWNPIKAKVWNSQRLSLKMKNECFYDMAGVRPPNVSRRLAIWQEIWHFYVHQFWRSWRMSKIRSVWSGKVKVK